jgi:hypothetical protein
MTLALKVVEIDSKIIIMLPRSKSVKLTVVSRTVYFTDLGKLNLLMVISLIFLLLPKWPLKMTLAIKVVKIDMKNNHQVTLIEIGETDCRSKLTYLFALASKQSYRYVIFIVKTFQP